MTTQSETIGAHVQQLKHELNQARRDYAKALMKEYNFKSLGELVEAVRKGKKLLEGGDEAMSPDKPA